MFYLCYRLAMTVWYTLVWMFEGLTVFPGLWKVFELRAPRVTFFGGAKVKISGHYAKSAKELARMLTHHDVSIITGGGGGVMEAAALGAQVESERRHHTMINNLGLSVTGLDEGYDPKSYTSFVRVKNFAMRKWLMINFSSAFVVFPGGVGTYDELAELLTLMDTGMLRRNPIVLFGKEYWQQLTVWVDEGIELGFIAANVKDFFIVVDDIQSAFDVLCVQCRIDGAFK
jgi:uncharacterized protein (TIGR00730 family)